MTRTTGDIYSSGDLSRYFNKVVVDALLPNTFLLGAGTQATLPAGQNKYVFSLATKAVGTVAGFTLAEGVTPAEGTWSMTQAEVSLVQLGDHIILSDVVLKDSPVEIVGNALSDIAMSVAAVADIYVQDILDAGTNVIYSGTAADRDELSINENLTAKNIAAAVALLRNNHAKTYDGNKYMAVASPMALYDLRTDTATGGWLDANKYVTPDKIFNGEVGSIAGARVVESSNIQFYADAGNGSGSTGTIDVYPTYVFGKDAYGVVKDGEPQSVYMPLGSSGTADPLKQRASAGVKFRIGATILRQGALYRIESASSIGANA